jgi:hypothetical protein
MKTSKFAALLIGLAFVQPAFARQDSTRRFDWRPANNETVRLDPANYHAGRTYHPGPNGGNLHVEIQAQQPVTIFMVHAEDWNNAVQHPQAMANLHTICENDHVSNVVYTCELPPAPMTLIVRDDRGSSDPAVFAGLGAVLNSDNSAERAVGAGIVSLFTRQGAAVRQFHSPNDVHIQYFRWDCVENCIQPEFQWRDEVKEKYDLTSFLKVYGGYTPQYDGEQVSVKIKSPVPMVVAILPSNIADQLHSNPGMLESSLQTNSCQQRGVQNMQFQCTFNAGDGPQSLIVAPEQSSHVPHKKAEIEWLIDPCVGNCSAPGDQ